MTARPNRDRFLAAAFVAALLACALPAGASAAQRWAAPDVPLDSSANCSEEGRACNIVKAVNGSAQGDDVIVTPGTYTLLGDSSATLQPPFGGTTVRGRTFQVKPLIVSDADQVMYLDQGSTAKWLALQSNASADNAQGLVLGDAKTSASQIESRALGKSSVPCEIYGQLSNSLCYATGAGANALETRLTGGLAATPVLRNVTAVASRPDASAVYISATMDQPSALTKRPRIKKSSSRRRSADGGTSVKLTAVNVIASGGKSDAGGVDFRVNASGGSTAAASVDYSNYASTQRTGAGASVDPAGSAHNQTDPPKFKNASAGDFQEDPCSPTRKKGLFDLKNGEFDLAGYLRYSAPAPPTTDIGAYESKERCPSALRPRR